MHARAEADEAKSRVETLEAEAKRVDAERADMKRMFDEYVKRMTDEQGKALESLRTEAKSHLGIANQRIQSLEGELPPR